MRLLYKIRKLAVTGAVVVAVLLPGTPAYAANKPVEIKDIANSSDFAMQAIHDLAYKGIISGDADGNFHPQEDITRAEAAKILVSVLGLGTATVPDIPTFSDVPRDSWAYGYVEAAYQAGIVNGVAPDLFDPDGYCTREQLAKMFVESLDVSEGAFDINTAAGSGLTAFKDYASISNWAVSSVKIAVYAGIMKGTGADFLPQSNATKEQMAVIADRFIQKKAAVQEELDAIANTQVTGTPNGFEFVFSESVTGLYIQSVTDQEGNFKVNGTWIGALPNSLQYHKTYSVQGEFVQAEYSFTPQHEKDILYAGQTYHVKYGFTYADGDKKTIYCEKDVTILPAGNIPRVLGVVPLNANQLMIQFSDSVTTASADNIANYVVTDKSGAYVNVKSAEDDGFVGETRNAILDLSEPLTSREKLDVSVNGGIQRFSDLKSLTAYSCTIVADDQEAPTIEKTDWGNDGKDFTSVTLYFNEPVMSGTVFVDNMPVGTANGEKTTITGLTLDGSTSHSIYVANASDGVNTAQNTIVTGVARLYDPPKTDVVPPSVESTAFTRDTSGRVSTISITYDEQILPSIPTGHIDAYDGNGSPVYVMQWITDENGNRVAPNEIFCTSTQIPVDGRTVIFTIVDGINSYSGKYTIMLPAGLVTDMQYNDSAAQTITVEF